MTRLTIILSALLLAACNNVTHMEVGANNRQSMLRLDLGISSETMIGIMGTETARPDIINPFKREIFQAGDKTIVAYYYYTSDRATHRVTDDEITPVVFIDNKLVGIGYRNLEDTIEKYRIEIRNR